MARSIDTIYAQIIVEKANRQELDALDSTSATAIYRLWAYVVASVIFTLETLFDLHRAEVEGIIATQKPGSLLWYRAMCLGYKPGAGLVVENGRVGYPPGANDIPPLIAQCSVREAADGIVIKIAKEVAGELEPLSTGIGTRPNELNPFSAYLAQIKYAGTPVRIINSPAELLIMNAVVFYDPIMITASGTLIADGSRPVDNAIQAYLRNLPFDGRLKRTALIDAILAAPGVKDVQITTLSSKYEQYPYEPIPVSHIPIPGYFKIDPNTPLTNSLTYQAYV
ncbi:MAG: hypothetical protein RBS07_07845 [Lentimicrobium sp.]|jgi:hypothetical protein|nr:hypothetical protein [Lentimicrobium sp.]